MCRNPIPAAVCFLVLTFTLSNSPAQTLRETLELANVPITQFATATLNAKIISHAVSYDDPFLLAYYMNDGSGTLHVIRYAYAPGVLRRAEFRETNVLFKGCLGSALRIREHGSTIYIETHRGPSAGCVLVLSARLVPKTSLSGWLLGFMGSGYAIVRRSEIHFRSVQPLHITVFNVARNHSTEVYPDSGDSQRREFARLIEPHISMTWCAVNNAECNPANFSTGLLEKEEVVVNETAGVFGFEAEFDAEGFGPAAEKQVPRRTVAYVFRKRGDSWEHREFQLQELQQLSGAMSFVESIQKTPDIFFKSAP